MKSKNESTTCSSQNQRKCNLMRAALLSAALIAAIGYSTWAIADTVKTQSNQTTDQIEWHTDLNSALAEAKTQDKKVLLRFSADWCPPCKVMDIRVWPNESIQSELASNYIAVSSDIDEKANQILAAKYKINSVPALLLLDENGNELARGGFMSPSQLKKFLSTPSGEESSF